MAPDLSALRKRRGCTARHGQWYWEGYGAVQNDDENSVTQTGRSD